MERPSYSPLNLTPGIAEDYYFTTGLEMPHTNYTPPCHLSNVTGTSTLCGCELSPAVLCHASMVQMQHTAVAQAGFDCHAEKVESNSFEELHLGNTGGAT